ncbi:MAG: hypothetical protein ACTSSP_05415 [Candidatus Asgardarchaeia archaeon]
MTSRDDKITSVRIRKDIWKKAKIIAIEEGENLKISYRRSTFIRN